MVEINGLMTKKSLSRGLNVIVIDKTFKVSQGNFFIAFRFTP